MALLDKPVTRKSLPMSARDVEDLKKLRSSPELREALAAVSAEVITETSSEAAMLHAVMKAGKRAVREHLESVGYAEIAQQREEYNRQAVARRRRPTWADE